MGIHSEADLRVGDLISVVRAAGEILYRYFRKRDFAHVTKTGRANIVTEADLASQRLIANELSRRFPRVPVVGEEGEAGPLPCGGTYFLVDPLDGTLNFLHGIPFYSVSIALMREGRPMAGGGYAPALGGLFHAMKGVGAFLNGRKLNRPSEKTLHEAIAVTGWPYDSALLGWVHRSLSVVQEKVQEVRILGASSLEMCYVAAGLIDVYWEVGLYPWDLAAGWVMVEETGGIVSDLDGAAFDLVSGRVLAVGCRSLHKEMLRLLGPLSGAVKGVRVEKN